MQSERDKRSTKRQETYIQSDGEYDEGSPATSMDSSPDRYDRKEVVTYKLIKDKIKNLPYDVNELNIPYLDGYLKRINIHINWNTVNLLSSELLNEFLYTTEWLRLFCNEFNIDYDDAYVILKKKLIVLTFINVIGKLSNYNDDNYDNYNER